jgi:hypothetical protein
MSDIIGTLRYGTYPEQNVHNGVVVYCAIKDEQQKWEYAYNGFDMRTVTFVDTRKPVLIIDHCYLSLPRDPAQPPGEHQVTDQKMPYYVALYEDKTILLPELWVTTIYSEHVS